VCEDAFSIQAEAYAEFDRWLARQSDEVQDMNILEQIELYAEETTRQFPALDRPAGVR